MDADPLTGRIIGCAIEVHRLLGPGLLEAIYERALHIEFTTQGVQTDLQVPAEVNYKGHIIAGQRLDLVVEKEVVVEVKSRRQLPDIVVAQVLSYLKATHLKRALVISFGKPRLVDGITRIPL